MTATYDKLDYVYISQWAIQPLQSTVTDVKLESKRVCKSVMCAMLNLEHFSVVLIFENSSSMGFRSGDYGGRKSTSAPTSSIDAITSARWWMKQLSNTTTE